MSIIIFYINVCLYNYVFRDFDKDYLVVNDEIAKSVCLSLLDVILLFFTSISPPFIFPCSSNLIC